MSLQVCRVDHHTLGLGALARKSREDLVEHAEPAPADEAIVERLVRAVRLRGVLPLQPIADHVHDPAHHAPVVDPRHPVRQRKVRRTML